MSTELARRSDVVNSLEDVRNVATLLARSGYFGNRGSDPVAAIATAVLAGREMGFAPFASVQGIHIIQGKPTVSANLMAAAVKGSAKYDYRVREHTDVLCRIEFFERINGKLESLGFAVFTAEDAKRAGTQNMSKFPKNMLFARCMSNGVRTYTPDVFSAGVYTPEELGATVNGEGEIIEGEPARVIEQPAAELLPWQTWKSADDALAWAAFELDTDLADVRQQYADLKATVKPKKAAEMFQAWYTSIIEELERSEAVDGAQARLVDDLPQYT
jgi:hypothetical protein